MAIVWFVRDMDFPTRGYKQADKDIDWCIRFLRLKPERLMPPPARRQIVGGAPLGVADDSRYVVVEVTDEEADGWAPGYYSLLITPHQARALLRSSSEKTTGVDREKRSARDPCG
jgi:hypothetical protein